MPISTNAPFNEFGQSQILRDIEQLYLALNGAGSGGPGDGQTQDQSSATEQDISGLATVEYVDSAIAEIPSVSYPISVSNGGTGSGNRDNAIQNLYGISARSSISTTSGSFVIPSNVNRIRVLFIGGGGGGGANGSWSMTDSGGDTSSFDIGGGGGGGGALGVLEVDVASGETLSFTIGAGGSAGGTGGDGTATIISMTGGASSFSLSAYGGSGGQTVTGGSSSSLGGAGGYVYFTSGSIAARNGVLYGVHGGNGMPGCINPNTVGAIGGSGFSFSNASSITYGGYGGVSADAGATAGSAGFVAILY